MKLSPTVFLSIPVLALALAHASDADACGGCFVPPMESTQVTGHRMILSVSKTGTTLYDQIEYAGSPSSFAWVLPTKGTVEVGLSSDALFSFLEAGTATDVYPPQLNCPAPPACWANAEDGVASPGGGTGSSGAGGANGGGVSVVAQAVVGPYETVQLSSQDPAALKDWLTSHGYNLPPEIGPVVDAYVLEGFNFLALKLVPGQGISAMRPVRITTAGAGTSLPLRMVAAGTGATTKMTLFVLGEGRYETANFGNFTLNPADISWNWDTSSSNLADLKDAGFAASKGLSFLSEAAEPFSQQNLEYTLGQVVQSMPNLSGYGDANGMGALDEYTQDVAHLFGSIDMNAAWITRLHGELPRPALANDLVLGASMDQSKVTRQFQATKFTGQLPACPTYPPCPDQTSSSGGIGSGVGGAGFGWLGGNGDGKAQGTPSGGTANFTSSCAVGHGESETTTAVGLGLLLALAMRRRRNGKTG
jgi:MYXO-CTERM domain-containing protein